MRKLSGGLGWEKVIVPLFLWILLGVGLRAQPGEASWRDVFVREAEPFVKRAVGETEGMLQQDAAWVHGLRRIRGLQEGLGWRYEGLQARHGRVFVLKRVKWGAPSVLVWSRDHQDAKLERLLLDPAGGGLEKGSYIDWFTPSLDGKWVAVAVAREGEANCQIYVYDVDGGGRKAEVLRDVPRGRMAEGVAWISGNAGFFYPRWVKSQGDEVARVALYQHRLGAGQELDLREVFPVLGEGNEMPRIWSSMDGQYAAVAVRQRGGKDLKISVRFPSSGWKEVTAWEDEVRQAEFGRDALYLEYGRDQALYVSSFKGVSKGRILRATLGRGGMQPWVERVAEYKKTVKMFAPTASGLAVLYQEGVGVESHYQDDFDDKVRVWEVKTAVCVDEMQVVQGDEMVIRSQTYTEPAAYLKYDPNEDKDHVKGTALNSESAVDYGDVEWVRETAKGEDGTRLPLGILRKRGLRQDGRVPVVVLVHGAEGDVMASLFSEVYRPWLEQGGMVAVAHVRGGGEYGEDWRRGGVGTNKWVGASDLAAQLRLLVASNYTSQARMGLLGSGWGSLVVSECVARYPELVGAVVMVDGIFDLGALPGLRPVAEVEGELGTSVRSEWVSRGQTHGPLRLADRVGQKAAWYWILSSGGGWEERAMQVYPMVKAVASAREAGGAHSGRGWGVLMDDGGTGSEWGGTGIMGYVDRGSLWAKIWSVMSRELGLPYSLIARGPWSGGVTDREAVVKARLAEVGLEARLWFSEAPNFDPSVTRRADPVLRKDSAFRTVEFRFGDLKPLTTYYYRMEVEGRAEMTKEGRLQTFPPPGPASFKMAFASCARTGSTLETFDRIREERPLFFLNMGDFHYQNINTNSTERFLEAYDRVLASPQQSDLYRSVPFDYVWDDHDFGGNNSNRKASSHVAAKAVYDAYAPHYPLVIPDEDGGINHAFTVGRVRFIVTDLRYSRDESKAKDTSGKSMMGMRQKEWFKRELLQANGKYPLICWVSSVPWIGQKGSNYYSFIGTDKYGYFHHTNQPAGLKPKVSVTPPEEDHWSVYTAERTELADFVKAKGIRGLCILHGDSHMLAADDGRNADYATGGGAPIPVMCAAPLDQEASLKGGPYSQGVYRVKKGEGCYGLLTVQDEGDRIQVGFSGRNHRNEEKISLHFEVPASVR